MCKSLLHKLGLTLISLMLVACNGSTPTPVPTDDGTDVPESSKFVCFVTTDNTPEVRMAGSFFEVTTDNCGSPVSSVETFSRSRQFDVELELELSQSVITEVGGGVPGVAEAKLGAEVGLSLGVRIGASEAVEAQRRIETPGNSRSIAKLQWEEVWSKGTISIKRVDGTQVDEVPFAALTTLHLTQLGIEVLPCPSTPRIPEPTSTPISQIPTATLTLTPKPDAVVKAEALNVRSGPGVVYDIRGVLTRGDRLDIKRKCPADEWLEVDCLSRGLTGWVNASLLEINLPLASVPVASVIPPMPTPVHTPIPAVTSAPTLLPPPIPLEPEDGAHFLGEPVALKWKLADDRSLEPDEVFSVRVRREGETQLCHHDKADKLEYKASLSYCTAGTHYWSVALVRDLDPGLSEEDLDRWQDLSESSEERWFYYVPAEEPWTWPTPDDHNKGNGNGICDEPPCPK